MDHDVVRGLRRNDIDLVTVAEVGRRGLSDEEQLIFAVSQGRVLFSCNRGDFARIHARWMRTGRSHRGVILGIQDTSVGVQIRALTGLAETLDSEAMHDRLEYLSSWQD